ncbi:hypothetical protein EB810_06305 [Altererythrobacter sp. FM1]|uniref:hypothetical protein n=1 Tax=Tsuneonella flava TaxID=2055955 RepID=UPI000C7FA885|nr:hypothetical protein [Tsuneonella flava]ROT94774.1 hypothetical protein EB810_06305 [Altererythrobacter sp. FM1]
MTKGWWTAFASVSLAINGLFIGGFVYLLWAYGRNLKAIENSQFMCLADRKGFDSIAAAEMIGRLDQVTFLLSMGGLLFALFAFMGFWMIRREVLDTAERVAGEAAREAAQVYYAKQPQPEQKDDKQDKLSYILGKVWPFNKPPRGRQFDPAQVSTEGAEEQLGDSDEKPK